MENSDLIGRKIPYSVKKLIAVNSITYCYVELPIDKHCALFGGNNVGKTSLLNALKLHFFPEISFNNCEKKFAFKSAKGDLYSTEDSYNYYFPTESSFLILEAENIHGAFCLLLFKSNRSFGYERLALPCSYDDIRENFWDIENTQINNGLGSPVEGLCLPKVYALHQKYKKEGAIILKTKKDIKERLFTHSPLHREKGRYCLVPLKENGTEREIMAFRQLMNFTFEIAKTDTKGLTETFATIIESDKISSKSQLHQDLQKILDDYNNLRDEQDKLKKIENYRDNFNELNDIYQSLNKNKNEFINTFTSYFSYLKNKEIELKKEYEPTKLEAEKLLNEEKQLIDIKNDLKNKHSDFNGELRGLNKDIKAYNENIKHCDKVKLEYPKYFTLDNIIESLKRSEEKSNEEIKHLSDNKDAMNELSNKIRIQKTKKEQLNLKNNALNSQENLFVRQLSKHGSIIFNNLNPIFSELTVKPDLKQLDFIENFGNLFSINNEYLNFLGDKFSHEKIKDPQEIKQKLQKDINDLGAEINKLDFEIQDLGKITKSSKKDLQEQIQRISKKIKVTQKDLRIIKAIEETQLQRKEKSSQADRIKSEIEGLKQQQKEIIGELYQTKNDYLEVNKKQEELNKNKQDVNRFLERLKNIRLEKSDRTGNIKINTVSANDINNLEGDKEKLIKINENLDSKISDFIRSNYFHLPIEIALANYNKEQKNTILVALQSVFSGLYQHQETLESRIIEHNKMTDTKITELTSNRDYINTFINKVNKQFEKYKISNLQNIKVEITLDERFEALINELHNTNLHTTDIHDNALYHRLNIFCEDFFTGSRGNRILEMRKIITGIKYSYQKQHQDKRENKDQSTGTNALINCTLLTILLGDLLSQDTQLTIPVIFDEFTMLDEHNQRTAIQATTEHGFALFCASATDTAEVVSVVDHYIHLDDCHVSTTYDDKGERDVVFHHYQERLYEVMEQ